MSDSGCSLNVQDLTEIAREGFTPENGRGLADVLAGLPEFLEAVAISLQSMAGWMDTERMAAPYSSLVGEIAVHVRGAQQAAEAAYGRFYAGNGFWLEDLKAGRR